MKSKHTLLSTVAGLALAGVFGAAQAQTPATPATSPTVAQTVKPPPMSTDDKTKPTPAAAATAPTVAQTVKPGTGTMPTTTPLASPTSPTVAQTVKPSTERKAKPMKKSKAKTDPADLGSGSSGTTPGRVEGTTNSNSKGDAKP